MHGGEYISVPTVVRRRTPRQGQHSTLTTVPLPQGRKELVVVPAGLQRPSGVIHTLWRQPEMVRESLAQDALARDQCLTLFSLDSGSEVVEQTALLGNIELQSDRHVAGEFHGHDL